MTADHEPSAVRRVALNFHKDAFSLVAPPVSTYPHLDGDLSQTEVLAVVCWLSHRSLWHVVRNWIKTRRYHLADDCLTHRALQ